MATSYKLYSVDIDQWTPEMENKHDYIKVYNGRVYFVSRKAEPATREATVPEAIGGWFLDCNLSLLMESNNKKAQKNMVKAKEQLDTDFEAELEKELAELNKLSEKGGETIGERTD